jgi:pyrimidine operon attenuation protein/uracil phosphoribosyltransferase
MITFCSHFKLHYIYATTYVHIARAEPLRRAGTRIAVNLISRNSGVQSAYAYPRERQVQRMALNLIKRNSDVREQFLLKIKK